MDPITQGALGSAFAQAGNGRRWQRVRDASVIGALSGMAADLDVLIQSSTDPLLFLEYHRHFTHALAFIPFGALICAGAFYFFVRRRMRFREVYLFCVLGYASHGLLDACTTYGTLLFWPFSDMRIAWNVVSVIDPLFSVPLVLCVLLAFVRRSARWTGVGLIWGVCYLLLGVLQNQRAETAGWELAQSRGHTPVRLEAKPGFANLLVWKVVYEHQGVFHVDAIRTGLKVSVYPGASAEKLDISRHLPWLQASSTQARDVERFRWFSNDYLAVQSANEVVDVRYSALPNEIRPLWGIRLHPEGNDDTHVEYFTERRVDSDQGQRLLGMLLGR
ncbi:MAG: metal-dependent hydrolase [Proteobacteria bacterium]|nr:metal-dependent hydrolase [Pseudomonadota bacterium]